MLLNQPVRQIAYYVNDVREAARRHTARHGSGPFFVVDFPPQTVSYRGQQVPFNITCAFGQWGAMQVELLQQNDDGPSVLHELYPAGSGKTGIHHMAIIVDSLEQAVATFTEAGYGEAARMTSDAMNLTAVFIDTVADYGHFIELYEPKPAITMLYGMVANAAVGFDGHDPVRPLKF